MTTQIIILCIKLHWFVDVEFFECIHDHVARKYDVESSEPHILACVGLHGPLHVVTHKNNHHHHSQ